MTIPAAQRDTATLLAGLAGREPIETHISAVFVGRDTVWKLRKAVRLAFLDFSTLAERHRAARREFELNAPHAPGLYRDVVPVTRAADGRLSLAGAGEVVDWVVRMAPVPAADFLEAMLARGALTPDVLDGLGDAIAAYHTALAPVPADQVETFRFGILGNGRSALAAGLDPTRTRAWLEGALAELAACKDWLHERGQSGFVRRGHGDLHLGNICLWQGRPTPFDALEFDEDLATLDIGYDTAFAVMDLDVRAGRPAANRVMNRVLARSGDWAMARGLRLFLSTRAMIRAHIAAAGFRPEFAERYLGAALAYQAPAQAMVVAVGGLQGTGKSTLARALAPSLGAAPGAVVLRSDEIRKRRHGVAPETRLPQSAYRNPASAAVFDDLMHGVRVVAGAGHAAVADATFLDPAHRRAVAAAAAAAGVPFLGVWLRAPMQVLEARVAARIGDASDAGVDVLRRSAAADRGAPGWLQVDATDTAAALRRVRQALEVAASIT